MATYAPKPCRLCGQRFQPTGPTSKWCAACKTEVTRAQQRESYYRRAEDPAFNRARGAAAAQRMMATPEALATERERRRAANRVKRARIKADPERAAKAREYDREWKRRDRTELRAGDPEAYEARLARLREDLRDYRRAYAAKRRSQMTDDERAEALRRARDLRGQRELLRLQQKIMRLQNDATTGPAGE